jgi:hypothetical protein
MVRPHAEREKARGQQIIRTGAINYFRCAGEERDSGEGPYGWNKDRAMREALGVKKIRGA